MPRQTTHAHTTPDPAGKSRASGELELRPLLGADELAQLLGVSKATLHRWHWMSIAEPRGPRAVLIGVNLRYTLDDLRDYIDSGGRGASGRPPQPPEAGVSARDRPRPGGSSFAQVAASPPQPSPRSDSARGSERRSQGP